MQRENLSAHKSVAFVGAKKFSHGRSYGSMFAQIEKNILMGHTLNRRNVHRIIMSTTFDDLKKISNTPFPFM